MKNIGIDLGSRYVKMVKADGENIEFERFDTVSFYKQFIKRDGDNTYIDVDKLGIDKDYTITATGYGRNLMSFANAEIISEIKAHFRGALRQTGDTDFILIDIGGQDSKVILGKEGYIEDFIMNDKCAASTGRFAENACNVLGISIDELSVMDKNPSNLSSTCAVFCESELIGLMASGVEIESIASGVNKSIAKRLMPLIKSFQSDTIYASGGVASNKSLIHFISELIGKKVIPLQNPQYNGALGCLPL